MCYLGILQLAVYLLSQFECADFLQSKKGEQYAVLRGQVFEAFVLRQFESLCGPAKAAKFKFRQLDNGVVEQLEIHFDGRIEFNNLADLEKNRGRVGHLCVPLYRNFPVVDALKILDWLFQVTVSLDHPVKAHRLAEIIKSLGDDNKQQYRLVFVVPEDQFDSFSLQNYITMASTVCKKPPSCIARVTQYVMCVPLGVVEQKSELKRDP